MSFVTRTQFNFGRNWKSFSKSALTSEGVERARSDFRDLMEGVPLTGKSFLDIGFGQGLALCLAREFGANVYGNEISQDCIEALKLTARFFCGSDIQSIPTIIGSILDDKSLEALRQLPPISKAGGFDIVHSWGVLHHTGAMYDATQRTASLVGREGYLVIAIYNKHWSSPIWNLVKRVFVTSPALIQQMLVTLFYPVIFVAKATVTRRNPLTKERGMDFYRDVIDWVGGYPYEYASVEEIEAMVGSFGFELVRSIPAAVPTGCNQFVFRRR